LSVVVFHLIWFIIFWSSLCEKGRWERGEGEKEGGSKGKELGSERRRREKERISEREMNR
jgi:hypothetical protein